MSRRAIDEGRASHIDGRVLAHLAGIPAEKNAAGLTARDLRHASAHARSLIDIASRLEAKGVVLPPLLRGLPRFGGAS